MSHHFELLLGIRRKTCRCGWRSCQESVTFPCLTRESERIIALTLTLTRVLAGPEGQTEWSCCEKDASSAAFCYPVETTGRTSGRFDIDIITRVYSICPTAVCSALNSCMVIVIMLLQVHVPYSVQLCSFKMIEWQACYGGQFAWSHAV